MMQLRFRHLAGSLALLATLGFAIVPSIAAPRQNPGQTPAKAKAAPKIPNTEGTTLKPADEKKVFDQVKKALDDKGLPSKWIDEIAADDVSIHFTDKVGDNQAVYQPGSQGPFGNGLPGNTVNLKPGTNVDKLSDADLDTITHETWHAWYDQVPTYPFDDLSNFSDAKEEAIGGFIGARVGGKGLADSVDAGVQEALDRDASAKDGIDAIKELETKMPGFFSGGFKDQADVNRWELISRGRPEMNDLEQFLTDGDKKKLKDRRDEVAKQRSNSTDENLDEDPPSGTSSGETNLGTLGNETQSGQALGLPATPLGQSPILVGAFPGSTGDMGPGENTSLFDAAGGDLVGGPPLGFEPIIDASGNTVADDRTSLFEPSGGDLVMYEGVRGNSFMDPPSDNNLSVLGPSGGLDVGSVLYEMAPGSTGMDIGDDLDAGALLDLIGSPENLISVPGGRDQTVQLMIVVEIKLTAPGSGFVPAPPAPEAPTLWSALRNVFSFRGLRATASRGNSIWRSSAPNPLRPVARPIAYSPNGVGGASRAPVSAASQELFQMFLTNVGNSTGEAFTAHFLNGGSESMDIDVQGLVVEPLKEEATKIVKEQLQKIIPENPITAKLNAYCLEFLRLPPQAEQMFQLAPKELQDQFAPIRDVLDVSKRLNDMGLLPADSDPASYFHAINQWAIWTQEEGFDLASFADAFVDHTRKNIESAGNQWTDQFDEVIRSAAPARWDNITRILDGAAALGR